MKNETIETTETIETKTGIAAYTLATPCFAGVIAIMCCFLQLYFR